MLIFNWWYLKKTPSYPYTFKFFKGYLPQILLRPFLNNLSQILCNVNKNSDLTRFNMNRLSNMNLFNLTRLNMKLNVAYVSLKYMKIPSTISDKILPQPATLLKKRLWHKCFPVNFVKLLRTPFLTEHLWWLLLYLYISKVQTLDRFIVCFKQDDDNFSLHCHIWKLFFWLCHCNKW